MTVACYISSIMLTIISGPPCSIAHAPCQAGAQMLTIPIRLVGCSVICTDVIIWTSSHDNDALAVLRTWPYPRQPWRDDIYIYIYIYIYIRFNGHFSYKATRPGSVCPLSSPIFFECVCCAVNYGPFLRCVIFVLLVSSVAWLFLLGCQYQCK